MVITFHRLPNTPPRDLILRGTVCWNLESTMFHWGTIPDIVAADFGYATIEEFVGVSIEISWTRHVHNFDPCRTGFIREIFMTSTPVFIPQARWGPNRWN